MEGATYVTALMRRRDRMTPAPSKAPKNTQKQSAKNSPPLRARPNQTQRKGDSRTAPRHPFNMPTATSALWCL
ncbi:hypothetical protein T484DRAFT_1978716 [Baffinella frigidus]|nr:hypothetical protein T484DRAFT_1978716 [Cryptophyta sp. CCMP2293]